VISQTQKLLEEIRLNDEREWIPPKTLSKILAVTNPKSLYLGKITPQNTPQVNY
jgi:hypothetical protein